MASVKNGDRRKRKYDEAQKARTAKNKESARARGQRRTARLLERTRSLIGRQARIRTAEGPMVGRVVEVLSPGDEGYPKEAERHHGSYLVVEGPRSNVKVSRHRVRIGPPAE